MARSTKTSSDAAATAGPSARSGPSMPAQGGASRSAGASGPSMPAQGGASRSAGASGRSMPGQGGARRSGDGNGTAPAPRRRAAKVDPAKARRAFVAAQAELLRAERDTHLRQADELQAEADSLAREYERGDVQFDEEGGEGATSSVDRELDLVLSAQARAAIAEIDRALAKIAAGTYGECEHCHQPIPDARLEALPQAALCVTCKAGGLSSRR